MLPFVGLNADNANILMMFTMLTILVWYVRIHCLGTMNVCMKIGANPFSSEVKI